MSWGLSPRPTDNDPWGSKSTRSTLRPYSASEAPRLIVVVVLPTPPFWLHIAITRALPWPVTGFGSGMWIMGRPVGPISTVVATADPEDAAVGASSRGWRGVGSLTR